MKKHLNIRETKRLQRLVKETKRKLADEVQSCDAGWLLRNDVMPVLEELVGDAEADHDDPFPDSEGGWSIGTGGKNDDFEIDPPER